MFQLLSEELLASFCDLGQFLGKIARVPVRHLDIWA